MRRGQTKGKKRLSKAILTRLTQTEYDKLDAIRQQTKGETFSSLLRKMVRDKPIRVYTHDESLDLVMEELAAHRAEILAIGVNINQMAKLYNTYPQLRSKIFYATKGYDRYLLLENKIDRVLEIVSDLAHIWLSE